MPLGELVDAVAAGAPAPAAGAVVALTAALAAGLVAKAVRVSSGQLPGADGLLEVVERLREDAVRLAEDDGPAYQTVVEVLRRRRQGLPRGTEEHVQDALRRASEVPAQIAATAAEVARVAARLAGEGKPTVRGDAVAATLLAEAAARSAAHLVEVNLAGLPDGDDLLGAAARSVDAAREAVVAAGQHPTSDGQPAP